VRDVRDAGEADLMPPSDVQEASDVPGDLAAEDRPAPDASVGARWESLGCDRRIRAIWGAGPSDVYFTAEGMGVLHLRPDGRMVNEAPERTIAYVWGRSATEVYATSGAEILRSDGRGSWTTFMRVMEGLIASSLVWTDANSLYVTGIDAGGYPSLARYRPGAGWTSLRGIQVLSVWVQSNEHAFIGVRSMNTAIYDYRPDSGEFVRGVGFPAAFKIEHRGIGVWGSALDDIYAIASNNLSGDPIALYHSMGEDRWSALTVPGLSEPTAIWGSSRGDVYVAQRNGTVLHLQGSAWTTETTPSRELLTIWGSDANTVYAGGSCLLRRVAQ
jgi:hypothetical protein